MKLGIPPDVLRPQVALATRFLASPRASWPTTRKRFELALKLPPPPPGTSITPLTLGGVPGIDVRAKGVDPDRVLLYFHGGGYAFGSSATHRTLTAVFGRAANARVCSMDYRLGPEHPFPAALDDALAAYRALLEDGVAPERIAVAGDSAGAGMTLALAMRLRADSAPPPAVLGLVCPWADPALDAEGARVPAPREPLLSAGLMRRFVEAYVPAGQRPADPAISPLRGDFAGLPAIVMHSGGDDLLAPDARAVEERARAAGVDVEHRAYDGVWHDFHLFAFALLGAPGEAPRAFGESIGRRLR